MKRFFAFVKSKRNNTLIKDLEKRLLSFQKQSFGQAGSYRSNAGPRFSYMTGATRSMLAEQLLSQPSFSHKISSAKTQRLSSKESEHHGSPNKINVNGYSGQGRHDVLQVNLNAG